jgi:hypothetical protein
MLAPSRGPTPPGLALSWIDAGATSHGHHGRKTDPHYRARRTLHTDIHGEAHVEVEVTSGVYQRMIAAHRENQPRLPRLRAVSSTPED